MNKILKICAVICGLFIIGIVWKFDDIVAYWGNKQTTENDDKEKYLISAFHNKYWEAEIEATKQWQERAKKKLNDYNEGKITKKELMEDEDFGPGHDLKAIFRAPDDVRSLPYKERELLRKWHRFATNDYRNSISFITLNSKDYDVLPDMGVIDKDRQSVTFKSNIKITFAPKDIPDEVSFCWIQVFDEKRDEVYKAKTFRICLDGDLNKRYNEVIKIFVPYDLNNNNDIYVQYLDGDDWNSLFYVDNSVLRECVQDKHVLREPALRDLVLKDPEFKKLVLGDPDDIVNDRPHMFRYVYHIDDILPAYIEEENGITILTKFLGVFGVFERIEPFDEEENSNTSSN